MNTKEAALEYLEWGLSVIPINPKSKRPCIAWSEYQQRQPTEQEVEQWFRQWPNANLALITGQISKVAAIDLDNEKARKWAAKNLPRPNVWQKTSKGWHLIYQANGTPIPNKVRIADGVDVRGDGGYIIVDPSVHPDTGERYTLYQHANWDELIPFPTDKLPTSDSPQDREPVSLDPAPTGCRNDSLARIAGKYFAMGMSYSEVLAICKGWNQDCDEPQPNKDVEKTVTSIWRKESTQQTQQTQQTQTDSADSAELSKTQHDSAKLSKLSTAQQHFPGNLSQEIRQFVQENQGSFTTADIDREFGLVTRRDKNRRAWALSNMVKELIIKRDARVAGKYHIIQSDLNFIDLDQTEENHFPIILPLEISQMVNIPEKCVIVVAGTSNSGKTAMLLQTLKQNLDQSYPLMYLMSEMGPSEYKQRVRKLLEDDQEQSKWKKRVQAASLSTGFDGPVLQHNPNGLTVIDFLEERDGEYYKIASEIRAIYDALKKGVAIIALQKHSQSDVGRGGEGTTEKARLYMTLDKLVHRPRATVSALKIYKAKDYPEDNPNGLEKHIEIRAGSYLEPVTDWMYCNKKQREQWIAKYEHALEQNQDVVATGKTEVVYRFALDDGSHGNLRRKDYEKWLEAYPSADVDRVLSEISEWTKNKKPLKKKGWFFQLSKILEDENKA